MMPYKDFHYIYPPRPEHKIPPSDLSKFDNGEFLAQPKYNGTCCLIFTNGKETHLYNRHKKEFGYIPPNMELSKLAHTNKWYVYAGEYLNKGKLGENKVKAKDKIVLWDILVWDGEYLIGDTLLTRLALLEETYPCQRAIVTEDGLEMYTHLCHTGIKGIYKAPTYTRQFELLYHDIIETDLYEGLVIKKMDSTLKYGFNEQNNNDWQVKCRKETKVYNF